VTPCRVAVGYHHFGGLYCLHFQLHPEDGSSNVLRNVGVLPEHYTASQSRKPRFESSRQLKHQISPRFISISVLQFCLILDVPSCFRYCRSSHFCSAGSTSGGLCHTQYRASCGASSFLTEALLSGKAGTGI